MHLQEVFAEYMSRNINISHSKLFENAVLVHRRVHAVHVHPFHSWQCLKQTICMSKMYAHTVLHTETCTLLYVTCIICVVPIPTVLEKVSAFAHTVPKQWEHAGSCVP